MGLFRKTRNEVTPSEAAADTGALLLDVREPAEWQAGHAPAARHIPLGALAGRIDELPRDRTLICICRSGNRSAQATRQLGDAGYRAVNMQGGMRAWSAAGLPMRADGSAPPTVV